MSLWIPLGGSAAAERLRRQVAAGDGPGAWLLTGAPGSGKVAAAVAVAAALNCSGAPGSGCGTCSSCLRIARRRHPDVHHVEPEGPLIPVDAVREQIIPEAARSPFEAPYKVFVIHEAEKMNDAAQNALLKTLEEPMPDTVFVLVADEEEELLDTIRSRCRIVRFQPLSETRIVEMLQEQGAPEGTARLAARVSLGDLEVAMGLALDDEKLKRRRLWCSIPRRLVSAVDGLDVTLEVLDEVNAAVKDRERLQKQEVAELADALGEGRGTAGARNALAARHRRELRRVEEEVLTEALVALATFYRDVVVLRSGGADAVSNLDLLPELESWAASSLANGALLEAAERCSESQARLSHNVNRSLALDALFASLAGLVAAPARVGARQA